MKAFDLEQAISLWRTSLKSSGKLLEDDIAELEDHLRGEIEDKIEEGSTEQAAFLEASGNLGYRPELEREFGLVRYGRRKRGRSLVAAFRYQGNMIRHYLNVARRNISRHPGTAVINVVGLSLALAICLVIGVMVQHELSYDRFHEEADTIHRVHIHDESGIQSTVHASLAGTLEDNWPNVESTARVFRHWETPLVGNDDTGNLEPHFYFADPSFLNMFAFDVRSGDSDTALLQPFSVAVTEAMAMKYFGRLDVVGESLLYNNRVTFQITAVLEDPPSHSHLQPDFIASLSSLPEVSYDRIFEQWSVFYTYVKLLPEAGPDAPSAIQSALHEVTPTVDQSDEVILLPVSDVHLHSRAITELEPIGNFRNVILMASIALLILLTAAINYVNLTTARTLKRAREVAIRKVSGARRIEIANQLILETLLMVALSLVAGVAVLFAVADKLNGVAGLSVFSTESLAIMAVIGVVLAAVLGLVAGGYPAIFFSRYQPARVLKGAFISSTSGRRLRSTLVFAQFGISSVLIVLTMTVSRQMDHVMTADVGFDATNVVSIPVAGGEARGQYEALRQQWMTLPSVTSVGVSASAIPGLRHSDGHAVRPSGSTDEPAIVQRNWVDRGYFEVLDIGFEAGEAFDERIDVAEQTIILNVAAARLLGWVDPADAIGQLVDLNPGSESAALRVTGVTEDFNYQSMHSHIGPLVFTAVDFPTRVLVEFATTTNAATVSDLLPGWNAITNQPMMPSYLEASWAELYSSEARWTTIFNLASTIALIIAVLGLFGLAAFTSESRKREIGIRKALGATSSSIMVMISRDFAAIILVSLIVTSPLAFWVATEWLSSFAYRTSIGIEVFIWNAIILLATGLITISWHTSRAALTRPAITLRSE